MKKDNNNVCHLLDKLGDLTTDDTLDSIFLTEANKNITYKTALFRIHVLTDVLKSKKVRSGVVVGIYLDRSIDAAISIYSVLYNGCAYLPLNKSDPIARIYDIMSRAKVNHVVTTKNDAPLFKEYVIVTVDDDVNMFDTNIALDFNFKKFASAYTKHNIAAIFYTSGSTGHPKLVAMSHLAMVTFADWAGNTFKVGNTDKIANLAPFSFDLSVFDLFTSLRFKSQVIFMSQEFTISPAKLLEWFNANMVTIWYTVPTMLHFWLKWLPNSNIGKGLMLRTILFAGEVMPIVVIRKLSAILINTEFYNLYGPVETNVCLYWKVDKNRLEYLNKMPIGKPTCGCIVKIDNKTSELYVKGPTLLSGYISNKFIAYHGWYNTKDCVSINDIGEFVYIGRNDRTFKIYGFRVAAEEVENALLLIDGIDDCVVFNTEYNNSSVILACIISNQSLSKSFLTDTVSKFLPQYMLPSLYLEFDHFPKLVSGKKDLLSIRTIALQRIQSST